MTELALPTPMMRLFDEIDLAPAPQSTILQRLLNTWREQRADQLLPSTTSLQSNVASALTPHIFVFSPTSEGHDFSLRWAGEYAIEIFGCKGSDVELSEFGNRRVAVYARQLFDLATRRQEAVCGRFTLHRSDQKFAAFEMLAAPVSKGDETNWLFGAVTTL